MPGAILVVEDDPTLGPLLAAMLEGGGHREVLLAADAPEALAAATTYRGEIALVVTDLGLPSKRGDDLARELTTIRPQMRVILMTGYTDERGRPAEAPATWGRLEKPFSVEALLTAVATSLQDA